MNGNLFVSGFQREVESGHEDIRLSGGAKDVVREDEVGNHPGVALKLIAPTNRTFQGARCHSVLPRDCLRIDPGNRGLWCGVRGPECGIITSYGGHLVAL